MKNKIKGLSMLIVALMLVTVATPVFAQSETDPVIEPTPEAETSRFVDHPIVSLLASFFSSLFTPLTAVEPGEGGEVPVEGEVEPTPEPLPVVSPEEAVAALHEEQDLGFGEIAKLLQITVEAQASCTLESVNCSITLDSLIAEYKAGAGMGELFQKYGKPEYTGVGQVRKAAEPKVKSNSGNAKGKK